MNNTNITEKILNGFNSALGPECDTAISSRARLARNFGDFPFPGRLNAAGKKKIVEIVNNAVADKSFDFIDFSSPALSAAESGALMERRVVSHDFVEAPGDRELIANIEKGLYVMVNEEDHLRIQCIKPGFAIYEAFDEANKFDDMIDEKIPADSNAYAYDENFGYLTQCPTNLGTGMRVSVMLHLPALTLNRKIQSLTADLSKIGLTIRGHYGEGTEVGGDLYQISNNITLGISEAQTLEKIKPVAERIIELERAGRNEILKSSKALITDKIKRAYGIIKNAHMITSGEFLTFYSIIRLGITYGIVKDIDYKTLDMLLVKVMPANLTLHFSTAPDKSNTSRDILRAEFIQSII